MTMSRTPCGVWIIASNVLFHLKPAKSGHDDSMVAVCIAWAATRPGAEEDDVGHVAECRHRRHEAAQRDTHRGQVEDGRDERAEERPAPDSAVDEEAVLELANARNSEASPLGSDADRGHRRFFGRAYSTSERPVRRRKTSSSELRRTSVVSGRRPRSCAALAAASPSTA